MCGIVAAVSSRNIIPILIEGLRRLEYRGYDSCGIAFHQNGELRRARSTARVSELSAAVAADHLEGGTGIAHTRWATHGAPVMHNAHPHFSHGPTRDAARRVAVAVEKADVDAHVDVDVDAGEGEGEASGIGTVGRVGLVHNGIIENHDELRAELTAKGYVFVTQTDTEVIAHLVDHLYHGDLLEAVQHAVPRLRGAYAIAVFCRDEPHRVIGARHGSPLVLGVGHEPAEAGSRPSVAGAASVDGTASKTPIRETFLASDAMALAGVTDQIVYLEDGDMADLQLGKYWLLHRVGGTEWTRVERALRTVVAHTGAAELGPYRHYMQKEIFEQPKAIADTLDAVAGISPELFGDGAYRVFKDVDSVLILACGTSYYSGSVAKYWLESIAKIPTAVEVASEYRYRDSVPNPRTLVVTITQSGETADTLAALKHARALGMAHTLTVCNVATSAMVRECAMAFITRAGVEIGVASTKAFTTQLVGLFLLTLALAQTRGHLTDDAELLHLKALRHLPVAVQSVLALEPQIIAWSEDFAAKEHALFLGRGMHYPIALEGALKLKEISYIHAEAYPAGELKHGPLALVTSQMPVVAIAPNDALLAKLESNLHEVRARGGELFVFADADTRIQSAEGVRVIRMPEHYGVLSPILHVVPLQLLAYHTAVARGTDVDKPRNLAKSVTVE